MQNASTNLNPTRKVIFFGDESVGKTSIIKRFVKDSFNESQKPSIGIEFVTKVFHLENKAVHLQLWDTSGSERFRNLIDDYVNRSIAAIIVYDITNQNSFNNVTKWIEEARKYRGNEFLIFIVGNKSDLKDRQVSLDEGQALAKQLGFFFQEVSTKTGENIIPFFKHISMILSGENISNTQTQSGQGDKQSES